MLFLHVDVCVSDIVCVSNLRGKKSQKVGLGIGEDLTHAVIRCIL